MASSAVRTSAPAAPTETKAPVRAAGLLPGILLLAVVGYAGKFIEHLIAAYGKAHHCNRADYAGPGLWGRPLVPPVAGTYSGRKPQVSFPRGLGLGGRLRHN